MFVRRLWQRWVVDVRERVDADADEYLDATPRAAADREMVIVFATVAMCLLLVRFAGTTRYAGWISSVLDAVGADGLADAWDYALKRSPHAAFNAKVFWAVSRLIGYVLIPLAVIRFALRRRVADFAIRVRGTGAYGRSYLLMFAVLLPMVVVASQTAGFQAKYPFYKPLPGEGLWPYFATWEVLYAAQFVALEFFFRGFMIHGLKRRLGYASIYVMVIPYMMIHFTKPPAEAAGSIVAGFILGSLSLKSNSIWWGAALHVGVAVTMDVLALWHRGLL